eukprot:1160320-Pelagomonas_calceolata.AAC.1
MEESEWLDAVSGNVLPSHEYITNTCRPKDGKTYQTHTWMLDCVLSSACQCAFFGRSVLLPRLPL